MFKNIKLTILTLFVSYLLNISIYGQTVDYNGTLYTPEGKAVTGVTITYSTSPQVMIAYTNEGEHLNDIYQLNAILLSDGTYEYNCAGYAFYRSEGYPYLYDIDMDASPFWSDSDFSNDNLSSYVQCSESEATHIVYYQRGHMVRKIKNSYPTAILDGRDCVSKWGNYGLYLHRKGYDPYLFAPLYPERLDDPNNFIYYKLKTTHSGILNKGNKTWIGAGGITHTLSGNVSVPAGISLTIKSGVTIDFSNNSYYILSTGGTINLESGVNFQGVYLYENGMIKGLFPTIESALSIVTNNQIVQTQSSIYNIQRTTTVPSGANLIISGGTTLNFYNGASLTVNGALIADAGTGNSIIFQNGGSSGSWGNLIFDGAGASNSKLNNVTLNNGNEIRCINGANVKITNSRLSNFYHGIYVYNAAPEISGNNIDRPYQNGIYGEASALSPVIKHNTITKTNHSGQGIYLLNGTNAYVAHNDISGCDYGIYIGSARAYFNDGSLSMVYPNNRFTENNKALCAAWGGYISGGSSGYNSGYNSIHRSIYYDVYAYQSGILYAQNNFWEGYNPMVFTDGTATVSVSNMLADDPWTVPYGRSMAAGTDNSVEIRNSLSKTTATETDPVDLTAGIKLEKDDRLADAISWYKTLINSDKYQPFALTELMRIKNMYSKGDILSYLEDLSKVKKNSYLLKLLGENYLQNGQFDRAVAWFDNALSSSASEQEALDAKFSKLFAYINVKKDMGKAQEILSDIKKGNVADFYFSSRIETAENLISDPSAYSVNKGEKQGKPESSDNSAIVTEYALSQNYPNPFNPSTVINFEIPKASKVSLRVYDILGKEVAALVDGYREMGRYSVQFNAKDLPSGMYIYEIRANNFIRSGKMLLMK